jgi:phenylalanyl-tRNA synthetase beta chain
MEGDTLHVVAPDHRMDIGMGVVGQADLIEEIARIHGYDKIPNTIIADTMPPQWANVPLEREERTRDILVTLGLRENISYRFTTPQQETLLMVSGDGTDGPSISYVELANPISADKTVLRHTLLISLLENVRNNARFTNRQQVFEIGNVYYKREDNPLPDEPRRLGILLTGPRDEADWTGAGNTSNVDFFDLKGVIEGLLHGLHITGASYERLEHATYHPGRSALLNVQGTPIGVFGELHPLVAQAFELTGAPLLAAELDLDTLLDFVSELHQVEPLPVTPPVFQDIALIVPETTPAAEVEAVIRRAGTPLLKDVRLFDVYAGDPIPAGSKSLAYNLVYQTDERTLTDAEVAKAHQKIVKAVERELGATLRA